MKVTLLDGRTIDLTPDNIESEEVQAALLASGVVGSRNESGTGIQFFELVDYAEERKAGVFAKFEELQLRVNGGDKSKLSSPPAMIHLREIHMRRSAAQQASQPASNDEPEFSGLDGLRGAFATKPKSVTKPKSDVSADAFAANLRRAFNPKRS